MRRQQSENGNNGYSGSGSSCINSLMQQFMKKMQNQGPDTLEARPRNANYYIRKEDSSSSGGMNFSMSSFTKTDDPFDIILMYYNDLKETSSNFNDDDSNAKVLAEAGTIYKIDTSAKNKHTKVENNLNTECLADAAAKRIYPALVHSTALYDGKLYFNVNNAIYRMDPTTGTVEEVKEYNTVYGGIKLTKDKDGNMITTHGGGTSRKRMHACRDYSGAEIMRTLRDEVINRGIPVIEFSSAVELIKDDKGQVAGAVLQNMETGEYQVAKAKTVIIATGGAGRLHYNNFPTSNHYGATADGLILGYRAGAPLLYQDTIQYHPTGAAYPAQIFGALVTEKVRSLGAMLVNVDGEAFMHPLETRDVSAASIIRECSDDRNEGVETPQGKAVWLDTPMIELIHGEGTIEKRIPAMFRMFMQYGIDMRKEPILVYPTLHYQNGGLEINGEGFTNTVNNLLVAGEAVGGIHGRNRLMGNSLLDVIVFGRDAGKAAAAKAKDVTLGKMNLDHVEKYAETLKEAGIDTGMVSPQLLPDYAGKRHL